MYRRFVGWLSLKECKLMNKLVWLCKVVLTFVGGLIVSTCKSQELDRDTKLPDVPIPIISDFESRMDDPKSDVISWMNSLESRLESLKYDCRIKADVSSVSTMNDQTSAFIGWNLALRRAKDPSKEAERYISVRQNPMDNLAIALGKGVAEDKRRHYDVIRLGDKVLCNSVTAFDYHVSEIQSETEAKALSSILNLLFVFDPIRACTSSATMVLHGHAQELREHCVLPRTVKSVLRQGGYVHVLLELSVLRSNDKVPMLYTFKDDVPVQVVCWDKVDEKSGRPIPTQVTRSLWKPVKDGEGHQLLPHVIRGQVDHSYVVADMEIFVEWDLESDVDDTLFKVDSLGKLPPAADVVFDVPYKFSEMVEGFLEK